MDAFKILGITHLILLGALGGIMMVLFNRIKLPMKFIALFVIGSFIIQIVSFIRWEIKANNLVWLHIYSIMQFVLLSLFYRSVLTSIKWKNLINVITVLVSIILILNSIYFEPLLSFNSRGVFISNSVLIVYSIAYFFQLLDSDAKTKNYQVLNSGVVLFTAESLVIFLFGNYLSEMEFVSQVGLWLTHSIVYMLLVLFIYIELWRHQYKKEKNLPYL